MEMEDELIDKLMYCADKEDFAKLANENACILEVYTEKHHSLQYDYYINCKHAHGVFSVQIESGISNGTQERERWANLNGWAKTADKEVFSHFALSFQEGVTAYQKHLATLKFANMEDWLTDRRRQTVYDNYVTGGNAKQLPYASDADKANNKTLQDFAKHGIFIEEVYREVCLNKSFDFVFRSEGF